MVTKHSENFATHVSLIFNFRHTSTVTHYKADNNSLLSSVSRSNAFLGLFLSVYIIRDEVGLIPANSVCKTIHYIEGNKTALIECTALDEKTEVCSIKMSYPRDRI